MQVINSSSSLVKSIKTSENVLIRRVTVHAGQIEPINPRAKNTNLNLKVIFSLMRLEISLKESFEMSASGLVIGGVDCGDDVAYLC